MKSRTVLSLILLVSLVIAGSWWFLHRDEKSLAAPPNVSKPTKPYVAKYVVKSGDTLGLVFGKKARAVCELNQLKNCNIIRIRQELSLPDGVEAKIVVRKPVQRLADGSLPIARLNVDPYGPHRTTEKDRKILEGRGYASVEIDEYLSLRDQGKCVREEFPRGTKFPWMAYGKARVLENLTAVWKQPEFGLVCQLQSGRNVVILEKCDNLTEVTPRVPVPVVIPPPVTPPVEEIPPPEPSQPAEPSEIVEPPKVEPPTPSLVPIPDQPEPKVKVRGSDYDAALYAGGDTSPVGFAGGIGAYYPMLTETKHGRLATGVGAFGSGWLGKTEDFSYSGARGAIGLANKLSTPGGVDFGIKFPAWGKSWERGHNSSGYQMSRTASLFCGAFDVTDARRERAGEKWNPEYLLYLQLCRASNIKAEHSYQGVPITDTTPLQNLSGIISVGGKLYWAKDLDTVFGGDSEWGKKLQPFVELGADRAIPTPWSWHAYPIGVRTVDKIWGVGVGAHVSQGHAVSGGAVPYDLGRDSKLSIERERWAEMVKSLEAQGVAVD